MLLSGDNNEGWGRNIVGQNTVNLGKPAEYEEVFIHQGRCCAICNKKTSLSSMTVDASQGLLCPKCKVVLNRTDRDPRILIRAAAYLVGDSAGANPYQENSVL